MMDIVIPACQEEFRKLKRWAEAAIAQVSDDDLHRRLNDQQNSVATIVKHMTGNLVSRWTDFLTSDGEKPTRDRESEFVDDLASRQEMMDLWDRGWACVFATLDGLSDADLGRTVYIRTEPHTVIAAIVRQIEHQSWHVGQIMLLAKHFKGPQWKYITIPPGQSAAFNRAKGLTSVNS